MSDSDKECIISIKPILIEKEDDENETKSCLSPVILSQEKTEISSPCSSKSQMTNPLEILRKLEIVKEIKNKTLNLQRIRNKLTHEVDCVENEDKSNSEFKNELDLLLQERVALLEELRQIDSDISTMEKTIKQSEEEKRRAIDSAKRLNSEYKPLKEHINQLRESIGLSRAEDHDESILESFLNKLTTNETIPRHNLGIDRLINEKPSPKTVNNLNRDNKISNKSTHETSREDNLDEAVSAFNTAVKNNNNQVPNHFFLSQMDLPVQLATAALMAHSLRNRSSPPPQSQMPSTLHPTPIQFNNHFQQQQQQQQQQSFNPFILSQINTNDHSSLNNQNDNIQNQSIQLQQPQFRQQPPPMKSCLSCNQQIHRNAPICPLCKAKSRSRNPKKPKKKSSQTPDSLSPSNKRNSDKNDF